MRDPYVPKGLFLRLQTPAQVAVFNEELTGQMSDGYWENSRPYNHWTWAPARELVTVAAEGQKVGLFYAYTDHLGQALEVKFTPPRRYNFCNSVLLECVGDRMLEQAKALPNHEWYTMKSLRKDLLAISKIVNGK